MAITRLSGQDAVGAITTGTSLTATYPGATTSGNLLIASAWGGGGTPMTISGFTGTTVGINGNTAVVGLFYKIADGTETTITATLGTSGIGKIHIYEYTGNANPANLDVALTTNGNGATGVTSFSSASITTTDTSDLIFVTTALNGSCTNPAYSTVNLRQIDAATIRLFDGDLIPGTTKTSFTADSTWTSTLKPSAIIGAFKGAAAAPASVKQLGALGVG